MNIITLKKRDAVWPEIVNQALKNKNLTSDIRVGRHSITIIKRGLWSKIKGLFGFQQSESPQNNEETLKYLKVYFLAFFSKKIDHLVAEIKMGYNNNGTQEIFDSASSSLDQIVLQLENFFYDPLVPTSSVIQKAYCEGIKLLIQLRKKYLKPAITPHFFKIKNKLGVQTEKWGVMRPAPHAENIVLSGGGVKGVGYIGAYRAMEEAGVLSQLQRVAGSSAGAITAALLASGMDANALQKASDRVNYLKIMIGESNNSLIQKSETFGKGGFFKGTYIVDVVNQEFIGAIKDFFEQTPEAQLKEKINLLKEAQTLTQAEEKELFDLREAFKKKEHSQLEKSQETAEEEKLTLLITFRHLALLRKIDSLKFKELTVTGFNKTQQKEQYFNAEQTPDMHIAHAVRISMSIPWIYKSVTVEQGDAYEDGAVGSATPTEIYPNLSKTLVLGFDDNGHFYKVVHPGRIEGHPSIRDSLINQLEEYISENRNIIKDIISDEKKLRQAGFNAFDVYHGQLGLMSFFASPQQIHAAELQAETRMWEQLLLRQNHVIYDIFESLEEGMKAMSDLELTSLVKDYNEIIKNDKRNTEFDHTTIHLAAQKELANRSKRMELIAPQGT